MPLLLLALVAAPQPPGATASAGPPQTAGPQQTVAASAPRLARAAAVSVTPRRPMARELTTFSGRLSPRGRAVQLEVRTGSRWRTVARGRVGAGAVYRLRARVPRTATYRVRSVGFTSRSVRVAIIAQGLSRTFDAPFVSGLPRMVTAVPTPRRTARAVSVQRRSGSSWTTVATRRTNASGVARIPVTGGTAGERVYRVVARPYRGAAAKASGGVVVRTAAATELLSVDQVVGEESYSPSVSADGRWVAFTSEAALLPSDVDAFNDIYLFDRRTGALTHLLPAANHHVNSPVVSGNGRFVAFQTLASNLFGEGDFDYDVAVLDRSNGSIDLVSEAASGAGPGNDDSYLYDMSDDGRTVAFGSLATDLVSLTPPANNGVRHAYVRNRSTGITRGLDRIGLGWSDANIFSVDLSADGSRVAFGSTDADLDPGDVDGSAVFAWDLAADGSLTGSRVNLTPDLDADTPSLSADGEVVAFTTDVALSLADLNGVRDTYLRTGPSTYVLVGPYGAAGNPGGTVSDDGRFVTMSTKNVLTGDTNGGQADVVVWTRSSGDVRLVTRGGAGASGDESVSADGSVLVFGSSAAITPDAGGDYDVFVTAVR